MVGDKLFGLFAGSILALAPCVVLAQTTSQEGQYNKDNGADQTEQKGAGQGAQPKGSQHGLGAGLGGQKGAEKNQCDCPCSTPGATPRHEKGGSFGSGIGGEQQKQGGEKEGSGTSGTNPVAPKE